MWLGDGTTPKGYQIGSTDCMCSRSFRARGAWLGRRPVSFLGETDLGRTGTAEWRRGPRGEFQAEGLVLAHLENTPVFKEESR